MPPCAPALDTLVWGLSQREGGRLGPGRAPSGGSSISCLTSELTHQASFPGEEGNGWEGGKRLAGMGGGPEQPGQRGCLPFLALHPRGRYLPPTRKGKLKASRVDGS